MPSRRHPLALPLALATGIAAAPAGAASPERLTVYSGGFDTLSIGRGNAQAGYATVQRPVRVSPGEWSFDALPLAIDPATVTLAGAGVSVRSQRYDFATADHAQLLARSIGQTISVEQAVGNEVRVYRGTLLSAGQGLTLRESDGSLRVLAHYGSFQLAAAPAGLVTRPTLRFLLDTGGAARDARLGYATGGLAWRAEYRAVLSGRGEACRMGLEGHAMVVNRSGVDFRGVALELVAGEPNRSLRPMQGAPAPRAAMSMEKMMVADAAPEVSTLGENHRYRLPGTGDLPDGSLQRLPLITPAEGVPCERRLVTGPADPGWAPGRPMIHRELGTDGDFEVRSRLVFRNERGRGLGVPLPAGRLRAFEGEDFLGEAELGHSPAGREIDLDLGAAFDLSASRRTLDFRLDRSRRTMTETVEWTLRNAKAEPTRVRLGDRLPRWTDWQLVEGGERFRKQDAQRIEAVAEVPAGGETVLRYTVRYRWAEDITID